MSRFSNSVWLILAFIFIEASTGVNSSLQLLRKEYRLTQADPLENAPPLMTFTTVALGGFRGLLADFLWVRSSRSQEEGKYFELVQLADWITKLEPRFPSVWAFHAWNLAYNVSVIFDDEEDRWRWVRHGLFLLRDEGLKYNPDSAPLYYELSWIFFHKIGGTADQAHMFYKRKWAEEMMALFDGPQPQFARLVNGLKTIQTRGGDGDWALLRFVNVYKMDPVLMREVDQRYGPLDWRLPQAHAIYWAWRSRQVAKGFESVAADRMIFQAMADSFRQGLLYYEKRNDVFALTPNLDILPKVLDAYEDALKSHPDEETIKTAHLNFLREAVFVLYTYHRNIEARKLFDELRERYDTPDTKRGFDNFLLMNMGVELRQMSERDAYAFIEGMLYQSLYWFSAKKMDRARGYEQLALLCWKRYGAARKDPELQERTGLPRFDVIRKSAADRFRQTMGGTTDDHTLPEFPEEGVNP